MLGRAHLTQPWGNPSCLLARSPAQTNSLRSRFRSILFAKLGATHCHWHLSTSNSASPSSTTSSNPTICLSASSCRTCPFFILQHRPPYLPLGLLVIALALLLLLLVIALALLLLLLVLALVLHPGQRPYLGLDLVLHPGQKP